MKKIYERPETELLAVNTSWLMQTVDPSDKGGSDPTPHPPGGSGMPGKVF